jgi:type 2 lantibiotic biosynthesis protein LanM
MRFQASTQELELGLKHHPRLQDAPVDPLRFTDELSRGFSDMHQALRAHRAELLAPLGPLAAFARDEVRCVLRPTQVYARLLTTSSHPDLLRDALDRDRHFDRLWVDVPERPWLAAAIVAEKRDLENGDIPIFRSTPSSRSLWPSEGEPIADVLTCTSMERVRDNLAQLSDVDLRQQLWVIGAAMATLPDRRPLQPPRIPPTLALGRSDPAQLLAAATEIGRDLVALGLRTGDEAVWLGLDVTDGGRRWSLQHMGIDLYNGVPGVALFLAYLGRAVGDDSFTAAAQAGMRFARRVARSSTTALEGIGGFGGWGGYAYALGRCAQLWPEVAWREELERALGELERALDREAEADVLNGAAGAILALVSLHRLDPALGTCDLGRRCGELILRRARVSADGLSWGARGEEQPLTGMSHGAAGIALALATLAESVGDSRYLAAAAQAIRYENARFDAAASNWADLRKPAPFDPQPAQKATPSVSWCHGAPGIGLARAEMLAAVASCPSLAQEVRRDVSRALATTLAHRLAGSHSYCHGAVGNLVCAARMAQALGDETSKRRVDEATAAVLAGAGETGWIGGLGLEHPTPGLMFGLAGIGHGLLVLARPAEVPCILALD